MNSGNIKLIIAWSSKIDILLIFHILFVSYDSSLLLTLSKMKFISIIFFLVVFWELQVHFYLEILVMKTNDCPF